MPKEGKMWVCGILIERKWLIQKRDLQITNEVINEGAYGVVKKGFLMAENGNGRIKIEVALKAIKVNRKYYIENMQIEKEIKTFIQIRDRKNQKHFLKFYGVSITPSKTGEIYLNIVTEKCKNDLSFALRDKKNILSQGRKISILLQISSAIAELHKLGIAHRDIKTNNILIGNDNLIKICDFGSCGNVLFENHFFDSLHGSVDFIDPVILSDWISPKDSAFSFRSSFDKLKHDKMRDIYAFGILIWEVFTTDIPYKSVKLKFNCDLNKFMEYMANKKTIRPSKRLMIKKGTPIEFVKLAQSCWNKEIKKRPKSFSEIHEKIKAYCEKNIVDVQ